MELLSIFIYKYILFIYLVYVLKYYFFNGDFFIKFILYYFFIFQKSLFYQLSSILVDSTIRSFAI